MTAHAERRRVPYSVQQMFDLVADVGTYPEFLPWISGARLRKHASTEEGGHTFEADLVVSFAVFRESYTSLVTAMPADENGVARIHVEAISGPFKQLVTHYTFEPVGDDTSDMAFKVEFAFRSRLLQRAAGAAFDLAMRKVASAFEDRAKSLYGNYTTSV